jgi:histidinol-phosphate aminotransferase
LIEVSDYNKTFMSSEHNEIYKAGSNENLFGISTKVKNALQDALPSIYNYPLPDAAPLRTAIADKLNLSPSEVMIGSGSAELISILVRTFCKPFHETNVLSVSPTYPLYRMESEALGVHYKDVPLNSSFEFEPSYLLAAVDASTKLCFLSNPNNPTGTYLNRTQLEFLVKEIPQHVTLVIDEAYIEYTSASDFADAMDYRHLRDNLVILRTFSKAHGLASLRVGYMIAQENVLNHLLKVKQPYNVNQLAQIAAQTALQDDEFLNYTLESTAIGKLHLQDEFDRLGIHHWPSEGNFLLMDAGISAHIIYQHLLQNHIQVRETENPYALRITIGKKEHQDRLVRIMEDLLNPVSLLSNAKLARILETGHAFINGTYPEIIADKTAELFESAQEGQNAADRISLAFAKAFSARLTQGTLHAGNLYSSTFGLMDMISAFNVLVKETPLVTFGHVFSNLSIARAIANESEIHLIDLGIGSGIQWLHFLDLMATRPSGAPSVRITGIDIPAVQGDPEQRLKETGNMLQQHADLLHINFNYQYVASKLEDIDLLTLDISETEALVVNSALTLHHIPDQLATQTNERDKVLLQIRTLNPKVFTLTEPDSEHNKLSFLPRLRESLRHYYTVFDVLDTLLPEQMPERYVIEQEFFGREIINVISCEGSARVERHERSQAWENRLKKIGFQPFQQEELDQVLTSSLNLHEHFDLRPTMGGYSLHWKNTPVIASSAWH